jgi:hypothetical protein
MLIPRPHLCDAELLDLLLQGLQLYSRPFSLLLKRAGYMDGGRCGPPIAFPLKTVPSATLPPNSNMMRTSAHSRTGMHACSHCLHLLPVAPRLLRLVLDGRLPATA